MMDTVYFYFSLAAPLLLHIFISELTVAVLSIGMKMQADAAFSASMAALITIPFVFGMYQADKKNLQKKSSPGGWSAAARAVRWFLSGGILNCIWSALLNGMRIRDYFSDAAQEGLLEGMFPVQVIGLGVLVPVAEELVFRGVMYQRMRTRMSVRWSILFSAIIFAVYHGNPIQMIFSFPMALLLAWSAEKEGGIVHPVAFHMGVNLFAVLKFFLSHCG